MPIHPTEPSDWFTAAFWWSRRDKFSAGKGYELERVRPHLGGVEPSWMRTLGERLDAAGLELPIYTGPDPAGPLARNRLRLLALLGRLPITERSGTWASDELARAELEGMFPGMLTPPRCERPRDPAALIQLAREGLAAHRLRRRAPGGFEVDLDALARLPTRPGYARYGARLLIDEGFERVGVEIAGERLDPAARNFEAACDRFEASVLLAVTVIDHALISHLACSSALISMLRARTPDQHPLRQALAPFCFNSARMNEAALLVLLGEGRYLHRLFALSWPGMVELLGEGLAGFELRTVPERLADAGLCDRIAELPFWEEALGWWRALEGHAARLVDAHVDAGLAAELVAGLSELLRSPSASDPKSTLARALAVLLWEVSVGHRQAGNVAAYAQDPRWMPVKVGRGSSGADRRSKHDLFQKTVLSFLGTRQHPPCFADDVASRLPPGSLRDGWRELDRELVAWEAGLPGRNARRGFAYEQLRRDRTATSAAV